MKTTLDLPDDLFRAAKSQAAMEGLKFKDLVAQGVRLRLESNQNQKSKYVDFPILKAKSNQVLDLPDDIASRIVVELDVAKNEIPWR